MVELILKTMQFATAIQPLPSIYPAILAFALPTQLLIIMFASNVERLLTMLQAKSTAQQQIHANAAKLLPSIKLITLAAVPL